MTCCALCVCPHAAARAVAQRLRVRHLPAELRQRQSSGCFRAAAVPGGRLAGRCVLCRHPVGRGDVSHTLPWALWGVAVCLRCRHIPRVAWQCVPHVTPRPCGVWQLCPIRYPGPFGAWRCAFAKQKCPPLSNVTQFGLCICQTEVSSFVGPVGSPPPFFPPLLVMVIMAMTIICLSLSNAKFLCQKPFAHGTESHTELSAFVKTFTVFIFLLQRAAGPATRSLLCHKHSEWMQTCKQPLLRHYSQEVGL